MVLQGNFDETLVNSLQGQLNCEIGGLDWRVITTVELIIIYRVY